MADKKKSILIMRILFFLSVMITKKHYFGKSYNNTVIMGWQYG